MNSPPLEELAGSDSDSRSSLDRTRRWIPVIVVVIMFRMYVVGDDGIFPMVHDASLYAQRAASMASNDSFSMAPHHRPGLSWIAWMSTTIGLPYKLFLDGVLVAVSLLAGLLIERATRSMLTGMLSFVVLMSNPWFMENSQMFMSEPLVALLMATMFLTSIPFLCRPVASWSIWPAIVTAAASTGYVLCRNETILLVFFWFSIFLVVLIRQRKEVFRRKFFFSWTIWRLALPVLPLAAALGSLEWVRNYHEEKYELRAICYTEGEGFTSLLNALYSIPPDEKKRFVPVTRESLATACDASAVLDEHRDILLDTDRKAYRYFYSNRGVEGEFGSWLNWLIVDAFVEVNKATDGEMAVAAGEIRQAQRDGRLGYRRAIYPCDPQWRAWLPELPVTLWKSVRKSIFGHGKDITKRIDTMAVDNAVVRGFFDDGLLRREGTGLDKTWRVYGVIHSRKTRATAVQVVTGNDEVLMTSPINNTPNSPVAFSFALNCEEHPQYGKPLMIRTIDNAEPPNVSLPMPLKRMRTSFFKFAFQSDEPASNEEWWCISAFKRTPEVGRRVRYRSRLATWHWYFLSAALLMAMFVGFRTVASRAFELPSNLSWNTAPQNAAWIAAVGLSFVAARCLFYSLIELWLSWGVGRYVAPNAFVALISLVFVMFSAGALTGRFAAKWNAEPVPPDDDDIASRSS